MTFEHHSFTRPTNILGLANNIMAPGKTFAEAYSKKINVIKSLAERGFDPRTSGLWAQHASTAPLCYTLSIEWPVCLLIFHLADAIC